ncbi:uncharacterized protein KY384_006046 [Bacidia gigantensis]|uniref:uncharacterized protein n=1 Tax=Bacidia gigantensis TaxID=2732470 RepID=UPI001D050CD0|nr:uncharacterized protein KY384_006046 [Bacidia gigantensis]KAG8529409.1 hypothetical protein KY384_006046 [Bacidia gigantensis]
MRSLVTFAFVLAASLIFTIECAPKPWEDDSEYAYVSLDINAGVATPTTTTTQNHDAEAVPYASLEALFNNPESKQTGETSPCPTGGRITTANGTASASGTGLLKITGGSGIYRSVSASGSAPSQGTGGVPSYPISGAPYQNVTSPIFPSPSIPGLVPSPNLPYGSAGIPSPGASGEVQPSGLSNFCPSAATVTMPASTVTLPAETVTVTAQAEAQASADASAGAQIAPAVTVTTTIIITVTANQGASCPTGGNAGNLPPSPAVPSFTDQIPPASPPDLEFQQHPLLVDWGSLRLRH